MIFNEEIVKKQINKSNVIAKNEFLYLSSIIFYVTKKKLKKRFNALMITTSMASGCEHSLIILLVHNHRILLKIQT